MKTSRIARETARVNKNLSSGDYVPKRQTRSFAASLNAFAANKRESLDVKQEDFSDTDSSLSSALSVASLDIEDAFIKASPTRKRKRGLDTPSTAVSTIPATTSTRVSPRKASAGINVKKAKQQPAKQSINEAGEVEVHPPANWRKVYEAVKEMRKTVLAPVDTMGCESLAEEHLRPRVSQTNFIPLAPAAIEHRVKCVPFSLLDMGTISEQLILSIFLFSIL